MVTKKDFVRIAAIVARIPNLAVRKQLAKNYSTIFAKENPRFNRKLFLTACGAT